MEHSKTGLFLTLALLLLASCKHASETPETEDPVYLSLHAKVEKYSHEVEGEKTQLENARKGLEKAGLTAGELDQVHREITGRERKLRLMTQDLLAARLQERERLEHDREVYPSRYEKGLPWPDTTEVSEFQAHERLLEAREKKWEDSVPKLTYGPEKTAPKAKTDESSGEAHSTE